MLMDTSKVASHSIPFSSTTKWFSHSNFQAIGLKSTELWHHAWMRTISWPLNIYFCSFCKCYPWMSNKKSVNGSRTMIAFGTLSMPIGQICDCSLAIFIKKLSNDEIRIYAFSSDWICVNTTNEQMKFAIFFSFANRSTDKRLPN